MNEKEEMEQDEIMFLDTSIQIDRNTSTALSIQLIDIMKLYVHSSEKVSFEKIMLRLNALLNWKSSKVG